LPPTACVLIIIEKIFGEEEFQTAIAAEFTKRRSIFPSVPEEIKKLEEAETNPVGGRRGLSE
jgi:hypothetical protein